MAGEGFAQHAINSLRMNRRKQSAFDKSEGQYEAGKKNPLLLQKAPAQKIKEIEAETARLKAKENIRLFIALLVLIILCFILLVWL